MRAHFWPHWGQGPFLLAGQHSGGSEDDCGGAGEGENDSDGVEGDGVVGDSKRSKSG